MTPECPLQSELELEIALIVDHVCIFDFQISDVAHLQMHVSYRRVGKACTIPREGKAPKAERENNELTHYLWRPQRDVISVTEPLGLQSWGRIM